MNYKHLLQRSTDWDTYKAIFDPASRTRRTMS